MSNVSYNCRSQVSLGVLLEHCTYVSKNSNRQHSLLLNNLLNSQVSVIYHFFPDLV